VYPTRGRLQRPEHFQPGSGQHRNGFIQARPARVTPAVRRLPCQHYTKAGQQWRKEGKEYPDLIARVRDLLMKSGKPYIIENVPGAPLVNPIFLNGSMFGLLVHRPRFFECNFPVEQPEIVKTKRPVKMGRPVQEGDIIQPVGHFSGADYARKQMRIDWMSKKGLAQAIPPAFCEYIGGKALAHLTPLAVGRACTCPRIYENPVDATICGWCGGGL